MNAREELLNLWAKLWADGKLGLMEYEDKHFKVVIDFEELAQAILDAGFVRLANVEIDEEKVEKVLKRTKKIVKAGKDSVEYWEGGIAEAIAKAKPIKLKEV